MSAPCFGWAIEQGRERNLPTSERFVLVVLSNRANGARVCWPSLPTIATDTGLSPRTVFAAVHSLATKKLIEIKRFGRRMEYRIMRPKDHDKPPQPPPSSQPLRGSKANGHGLSTGLSTGSVQGLRLSQPLQGLTPSEATDSCKSCIATIANGDSAKLPETGGNLRVSEEFAEPQTTKKENLERKQVANAHLEGSKPARREREPTIAEIEAGRRAYAASLAGQSDPISVALRDLAGSIAGKAYAPGWGPRRDAQEQIELITPRRAPRPSHLSPEYLAAQRSALSNRAVPLSLSRTIGAIP